MNAFQPLQTERLVIRELTLQDAQSCFEILSDERVTYMNAAVELITTNEQAIDFIKSTHKKYEQGQLEWLAVEEKASQKMIGMVGFDEYKPRFFRAAIGYVFAYDCWGKGYATEASEALIDFGFTKMNVNRWVATVDPENLRSIRVIEKLGMKCEGYLRQNVFHNKKFSDRKIYSILRDEWMTRNSRS